MTEESAAHLLWGVGALALVISALIAQRSDSRTILRALLAWAIIGTLIVIAVLYREEIGSAGAGIRSGLE
jgi:hypothetical protein